MSEKSLDIRHVQVLTYLQEPGLAPCWVTEIARDGKMRETGPAEAAGFTIAGGQEAKTEILVYCERGF